MDRMSELEVHIQEELKSALQMEEELETEFKYFKQQKAINLEDKKKIENILNELDQLYQKKEGKNEIKEIYKDLVSRRNDLQIRENELNERCLLINKKEKELEIMNERIKELNYLTEKEITIFNKEKKLKKLREELEQYEENLQKEKERISSREMHVDVQFANIAKQKKKCEITLQKAGTIRKLYQSLQSKNKKLNIETNKMMCWEENVKSALNEEFGASYVYNELTISRKRVIKALNSDLRSLNLQDWEYTSCKVKYEEEKREIENTLNNEFSCPITKEIMSNPVLTTDGFYYEEKSLKNWLKYNTTSPMTREQITRKSFAEFIIIPSKKMKTDIERLLKRKEQLALQITLLEDLVEDLEGERKDFGVLDDWEKEVLVDVGGTEEGEEMEESKELDYLYN